MQTRVPYCCNSWRCDVCRRQEAAVTFARIKQATDPLPADGWVFLVLTLDRDGYHSGKPWLDVNDAYRSARKMSRAALARIGRIWGPETRVERSGRSKQLRTVRALGNRWVSVIEAHRSGWPHCNLLVWCPALAADLRADQALRLQDDEVANAVELVRDAWKRREPIQAADRAKARKAVVLQGPLLGVVTASGWGCESTAEAAHSADAIAGYIVKMAGHHDAATGELAKITQAPLNAPERFRRLRSGKGFLPPRRKNPDVTGCLVRRRAVGEQWRGAIHAMNPPKDAAQTDAIVRAARAEMQLMAEEQRILLQRGELGAMPPMRIAIRGELEPHKDTSERRAVAMRRALPATGAEQRFPHQCQSDPACVGDAAEQRAAPGGGPRKKRAARFEPPSDVLISAQPAQLASCAPTAPRRRAPPPRHLASTTAGSGIRRSRAALQMRRATVSRTGSD